MVETILCDTRWAVTAKGTAIEKYQSIRCGEGSPILFIGGVHGDEPEGIKLAEDLLFWLQTEPSEVGSTHPWILIPCLNKDGALSGERTNANGVDLNRNFPSPDWKSEYTNKRYYPGPSPASESEVSALVRLIHSSRPQLIVHFHAWHPCVIYTGITAAPFAKLFSDGSGYPMQEDIGYPTPGSLGQYGWLSHRIPVICLEAEPKASKQAWSFFGPALQSLLRSESLTTEDSCDSHMRTHEI